MSQAFKISTNKSPFGDMRRFRNGIFYGCIENLECTPPCETETQAREEAQRQLISGGFRARLVELKKAYLGWIKQGEQGHAAEHADIMARIRTVDELIERLDAAGY